MGAVLLFAKDIEVIASEADAQSMINSYLKVNGHRSLGVSISPNSILIDFKADNSAQIKSDLIVDGYGHSGNFEGTFKAGIEYRFPNLYLSELNLMEGGFSTDETTQSELDDMKSVAIDILRRQRESGKIEGLAKSSEQSDDNDTELVEKYIIKATKYFFEHIPIYDVSKADKHGFAASLALKDVRFEEDSATIILSPVTALLRILGILGTILLTILWIFRSIIITWLFSRSQKIGANTR